MEPRRGDGADDRHDRVTPTVPVPRVVGRGDAARTVDDTGPGERSDPHRPRRRRRAGDAAASTRPMLDGICPPPDIIRLHLHPTRNRRDALAGRPKRRRASGAAAKRPWTAGTGQPHAARGGDAERPTDRRTPDHARCPSRGGSTPSGRPTTHRAHAATTRDGVSPVVRRAPDSTRTGAPPTPSEANPQPPWSPPTTAEATDPFLYASASVPPPDLDACPVVEQPPTWAPADPTPRVCREWVEAPDFLVCTDGAVPSRQAPPGSRPAASSPGPARPATGRPAGPRPGAARHPGGATPRGAGAEPAAALTEAPSRPPGASAGAATPGAPGRRRSRGRRRRRWRRTPSRPSATAGTTRRRSRARSARRAPPPR